MRGLAAAGEPAAAASCLAPAMLKGRAVLHLLSTLCYRC